MSEHIVSSYEEQLKKLHSTVLKMGALCESQFANSIIALVKKDEELVDKIIGKDDRIDELEKKIDEQVVNLITLRQPMAIDLRETVSAMRIASELERIGDLAKNIAKPENILLLKNVPQRLCNLWLYSIQDLVYKMKHKANNGN